MSELEQLIKLTPKDKRYLSRFCCGFCEAPLNRRGCSAVFDQCDEATRIKRREECLKART